MEPAKASKIDHEVETKDANHPEATTHEETAAPTAGHDSEPLSDDQVAVLEEEMAGEEDLSSTAAKAEKAAEVPKLTKVLAKEMAANGNGKFTLQIASYSTQEEAEKKVNELKALKFESFSTEATIKGHQWYRVNVGMFATIKEAQEHKSALTERAKVSTAIIQKLKR
jgi:septal ring-binding cell division protein DamX